MNKGQDPGERRLVSQVLVGDQVAVRRLYRQLAPKLMARFRDKVSVPEDVEELVQDTFLHLLDALPLFRFQASLVTFVAGIARHELMDYWRKKYAKRAIQIISDRWTGGQVDRWSEDGETGGQVDRWSGSEVVAREMNQALEQAFAKLKPIQAKLLRWKYEEGKSVKEIATTLKWSIKAVEAQLYRSRKAFQKVYIPVDIYE